MPGYTDQSRRYLRLAVENYKRANATTDPELKAKFIETAAGYATWLCKLTTQTNGRPRFLQRPRQDRSNPSWGFLV